LLPPRAGSECPSSRVSGVKKFSRPGARSGSRDHKIEPKSTWEPNEKGDLCNICTSKFNLIKRKHHCRKCGL
jgi:hypothetical protein